MQMDLWGNPVFREATFYVFHDESIPNKRWLLIGLTFVSADNVGRVLHILRKAREEEQYWGEVHFSDLPKSFEGQYGAKARVARRWMQSFEDGLAEYAHFSCLAVDRHSPAYDPKRFRREFHAYNRFTAMAIKAGIAWHLGQHDIDLLKLHFISDAKERASRPDESMIDNFEDYLPYRVELDSFLARIKGRKYPRVEMSLKLKDSAQEDLLQFTDVMLGATQMALVASAERPTKRELGGFVARWYEDTLNPPQEQQFGLHRKFNVWAFPDQNGKPCKKLPMALCPDKFDDAQLKLF